MCKHSVWHRVQEASGQMLMLCSHGAVCLCFTVGACFDLCALLKDLLQVRPQESAHAGNIKFGALMITPA